MSDERTVEVRLEMPARLYGQLAMITQMHSNITSKTSLKQLCVEAIAFYVHQQHDQLFERAKRDMSLEQAVRILEEKWGRP